MYAMKMPELKLVNATSIFLKWCAYSSKKKWVILKRKVSRSGIYRDTMFVPFLGYDYSV